jgi:DNA-binding LacI/PurR family transcriptional regulator
MFLGLDIDTKSATAALTNDGRTYHEQKLILKNLPKYLQKHHITAAALEYTGRLAETWCHALKEAGSPYRPELACRDPSSPEDNPSEGLLPLIRSLLQRPDPPTAFFAVNDLVAQRTHSALRKLGVCVPDDVALAGFDGTERWSPHGCTLTTANQPFESMGTRAVEVLLRRMKVGSDGTWQHVLLEAPIAIYQSTFTVPTKRRFNIPSDKERSK